MDKFEFQDGIKSKQRVRDLGEVFTPNDTVNDMLDMDGLQEESYRIDSTFLEPACGNGNFLVEILKRKLHTVKLESNNSDEINFNVVKSFCRIYGIDIMADNIKEAKERMMSIVGDFYEQENMDMPVDIKKTLIYILDRNIILGDSLQNKMANLKTTLRARHSKKIEFNEPLIFNEWQIDGQKITRVAFKADSIDIAMNFNYSSVDFDKLYTVKDKLEEEEYIL